VISGTVGSANGGAWFGSGPLAGMRNYGGRTYLPLIGRFLSPELGRADLSNIEGTNAYSYALNDPLSFADSNGRYSWKEFGQDAQKYGPYVIDAVVIGAAIYSGGLTLAIPAVLTDAQMIMTFGAATAVIDLEGRAGFQLAGLDVDQWNFASSAALVPGGMGALILGAILDPDHLSTWVTWGAIFDGGINGVSALRDSETSLPIRGINFGVGAANADLGYLGLPGNTKTPWDNALGDYSFGSADGLNTSMGEYQFGSSLNPGSWQDSALGKYDLSSPPDSSENNLPSAVIPPDPPPPPPPQADNGGYDFPSAGDLLCDDDPDDCPD